VPGNYRDVLRFRHRFLRPLLCNYANHSTESWLTTDSHAENHGGGVRDVTRELQQIGITVRIGREPARDPNSLNSGS
jgi:hypothetical protein